MTNTLLLFCSSLHSRCRVARILFKLCSPKLFLFFLGVEYRGHCSNCAYSSSRRQSASVAGKRPERVQAPEARSVGVGALVFVLSVKSVLTLMGCVLAAHWCGRSFLFQKFQLCLQWLLSWIKLKWFFFCPKVQTSLPFCFVFRVLKSYRVSKGPSFTTTLKKQETELTPEMIARSVQQ